jgi:tetrahydromethanopterin S-methyltransferase subunit A
MVQQKVNLPGEYPPEKGRYARGNDYSPVVVCVILDTFDFNIPPELEELVMAGLDTGAALSGMLQTENIGLEKMICNIVANPNIRYIVLCGRETAGHLTGQSLLALMENGVNAKRRIVGSEAPTPFLFNLSNETIERFRSQVVAVVNLLCEPGERDRSAPGLDPEVVGKAVWSCYQEEPVQFRGYTLYDMGANPEPPLVQKVAWKVSKPWEVAGTHKPQKTISALVVYKLLPGTNCQECGEKTCRAFASKLVQWMRHLEDCPPLLGPDFSEERVALEKLLGTQGE